MRQREMTQPLRFSTMPQRNALTYIQEMLVGKEVSWMKRVVKATFAVFFHTHLAVPAVCAITEGLIVLEGASGGVFASHHGIEGGQGASA